MSAPVPLDESRRLASLRALHLLDTPREERFDRITRLASHLISVPIALVTLVDADRQWFKSSVGVTISETPRTSSFCAHAILGEELFVVENALHDRRFANNPLVTSDPSIRFYAGAPLSTADGSRVGTLCVIDRKPRTMTPEEGAVLRDLADLVESELNTVTLREALAKVAESERWVRTIANHTPALIAYVDHEERFQFLNEVHRAWFGIDPETMVGRGMQDLLAPDCYHKLQPFLRAALAGDQQHTEQVIGTGQENRYADIRLTPYFADDGRVQGTFIHITDLSKRRVAEEALVESEELFRRLAHLAPVGIFQTNLEGRCTYVNERWCQLSGIPAEEAIRDGGGRALHPEDLIRARAAWASALAGGTEFSEDFRFLQKNGRVVWVSTRALPVLDAQGQPSGWLGTCSDITALTEARFETERARDLAETATHAKARFLANMSHEIRTPLSGVIGVIRILLEKDLGASERTLAETVHRNARSLLGIVNDVLDFSKVEAGQVQFEERPFSLAALLADVVDLFGPRASGKGLVLEVTSADELPARLIGDESRLRQVLNNLVSNAIKFTERGRIRVGVTRAADTADGVVLRFAVEDQGIGIALEAQGRVFDEFAQADTSTTRRYGGTGLGLTICQRLVVLMQGTIGVESEPGKGSTFYFTLPLRIAAEEAVVLSGPEATLAKPDFARGLRVLVADDSETNRFVAVHLLEQLGCVVEAVVNGQEAVNAAAAQTYDVIFMDCQMPILDGYGAAAAIRAGDPDATAPHIIALTAHALPGERERCLAAGMHDYLCKPLEVDELCACLAPLSVQKTERSRAAVPKPAAISQTDLQTVFADFGRNEGFIKKMAALFAREAGETLHLLQVALGAAESSSLIGPAHKLRGTAANFHAHHLVALSAALEDSARRGPVPDAGPQVAAIAQEVARVMAALDTAVEAEFGAGARS